jgi:predicted hydrocarbon binding protein
MMGLPAYCEEIACMANGSQYCEFRVTMGSDAKIEKSLPPLESKEVRSERKQIFYEVIHETRGKINDSLLMRKLQRPEVGDFMHISVLQPIIISLKLLDMFSASILYSGGRELGVFGPGKQLLYQLVQEKGVVPPTDLETGVQLLYEYITHPTAFLGRDYGQVRLQKADDETYILEIEENASIAGLNTANIGTTFCDFQAGFYAGRLNILIGIHPLVREIACQGTGSKCCKFEIKISANN